MKKILLSLLIIVSSTFLFAQKKVELFDLVKSLAENKGNDMGDWAVGKPTAYPVKWKEDKVTMSEDTAINFYRQGFADIMVNGVSAVPSTKPANVMLRGPRSGFMAYSILVIYKNNNTLPPSIDSLFGKKTYTSTLVKSCVINQTSGFNYYQVDDWSKNSVKLNCPAK